VRVNVGDKWGIAESLEGAGRLAAALGQFERAMWLADAAASLAEATFIVDSPLRIAECNRRLGMARRALGRAAADLAYTRGKAMVLDDAIAYAFAPNSPSKPRDRSKVEGATGPLTRRECEVVALVAQGLTNRDIAAKLILSERTVERHVENILSRLTLTSRTQIARWVVDRAKDHASGRNLGTAHG
jgi:DNA-binding CsgD family transcriptional regulator